MRHQKAKNKNPLISKKKQSLRSEYNSYQKENALTKYVERNSGLNAKIK
jgi:hypothetical protein